MPEPQWSNARPSFTGYFDGVRVQERAIEESKIHLLSSYSDDAHGLTSLKSKPAIVLPILSPNGRVQPYNKVFVSRRVHEELEIVYMIKHDAVHYERRYLVWVGIDLDGVGPIDTPVLDMAILSEKIVVQDIILLEGPRMPKRALWMAMYGYFGNCYKPEERKWAILAAKRHARLLRKLWERGDLRLVDEDPQEETYVPSALDPNILSCRHISDSYYGSLEQHMVFPGLWKERYELVATEKGNGKKNYVHDCVLA
ncbi:unnamed protein product [Penicillium glandicola]